MNERSHAADGQESMGARPDRDGSSVEPASDERTPELRTTVVKYETQPNRATIHPPGLTGFERTETWMSANTSAFVTLPAWR